MTDKPKRPTKTARIVRAQLAPIEKNLHTFKSSRYPHTICDYCGKRVADGNHEED